jgi:hypothetical protein
MPSSDMLALISAITGFTVSLRPDGKVGSVDAGIGSYRPDTTDDTSPVY